MGKELIRNNFSEGVAACQFTSIILFTDNTPFIVQLSAKACASDLRLPNGGNFISDKENDLSGFGVDFSEWTKLSCESVADKIPYFINDKLVYETARP